MDFGVTIRTATVQDAQALLNIYAYYVKNTAITYECEVPSLSEFERRITHTLETYPYLVAELDGKIAGYCYAGAFREKAAFQWGAEMTIYLDHTVRGHNIGAQLYALLESILKEQGIVKAIAMITPPETEEERHIYGSIAFHEKMGYHMAGRLAYSGYKLDRWYQTVIMEKIIGVPAQHMQPPKTFAEVKNRFPML